ncbi:MAG: DUF5615 family PIN-like protein [Verrucomicrobia bacterium]|nr:DUF5615 family PIN-like protein [Verrucomicrobiota bacterium]MCH8513726.1 DUF5615 family PIN-like protein [Kiritimatiellia bacterium]
MIWLDAHISPKLAKWLEANFRVRCQHVRELGLLNADDRTIFNAAKTVRAILMTKDADFAKLLSMEGPPPKVIWLRCGNTSSKHLEFLLKKHLPATFAHFESGENLVEIR